MDAALYENIQMALQIIVAAVVAFFAVFFYARYSVSQLKTNLKCKQEIRTILRIISMVPILSLILFSCDSGSGPKHKSKNEALLEQYEKTAYGHIQNREVDRTSPINKNTRADFIKNEGNNTRDGKSRANSTTNSIESNSYNGHCSEYIEPVDVDAYQDIHARKNSDQEYNTQDIIDNYGANQSYNYPSARISNYQTTSNNTNPSHVMVSGYYKKNGTYVEPYIRTAPNNTTRDNFSTYPNINPYTQRRGTKH